MSSVNIDPSPRATHVSKAVKVVLTCSAAEKVHEAYEESHQKAPIQAEWHACKAYTVTVGLDALGV